MTIHIISISEYGGNYADLGGNESIFIQASVSLAGLQASEDKTGLFHEMHRLQN